MAHTFARRVTDKTHREIRFLRSLHRTLSLHLPEAASDDPVEVAVRVPAWKTFRLRPEIASAIGGLQDRYAAMTGRDITPSEVIAAAFSQALPAMVAGEFAPRPHPAEAPAVSTFRFGDKDIRVVNLNGDPWFVAVDVC